MYFSQVYKVQHDWWRYIIGTIGAIVGVGVFSMPHVFALFAKTFTGEADQSQFGDVNYLLTLFEPNLNLVFLLLPFVGGLVALLLMIKFLHKQSFRMLTTAREKIDWKRFWFAFLFWGIISSSLICLDYFTNPDGYQWNFQPTKFAVLFVLAVLLIPLQTSFEEYLFRGYLMQGIGVLVKNRWFPLILTSVIFGLLHIANPEIEKLGYVLLVYYIGTGFFLGIMTIMDDGLELALGFHAANNLFTALLVTADWTAFQTHSIFKDVSDPTVASFIDVFAPVFIIFPVLLFIFAKVYKWTGWREKLFGRVEEPPKEDYKVIEDTLEIE